jgi:hypothetical protein
MLAQMGKNIADLKFLEVTYIPHFVFTISKGLPNYNQFGLFKKRFLKLIVILIIM